MNSEWQRKKMKILTINPGSTSVKYSLFEEEKKKREVHFKKENKKYLKVFLKIGYLDYSKSVFYFPIINFYL